MACVAIGSYDGKTLTRYLQALAHPRRRYTLYYLYDRNGGDLAGLAKYVISCERNRSPSDVSENELKSIQAELHHNHLQHLVEAGLISYDQRTGDVKLEDLPMPFLVLLGVCRTFENPPS